MDIIFHGHHAAVSDRMRQRAAAGVRRLTPRLAHAVDAIIRFEQDGPIRRVEIILHAPRQKRLVAEAEGRFFGPAIVTALARLQAQITASRRTARARATLATRALQA
jgi:ribosome-associated translation inhibitor RaiA